MVSQLSDGYFGRISVEESTADSVGLTRLSPATPVQRIWWQVPERLANRGLPVNSLELLGVRDYFGNLRILPTDTGALINYSIPIGIEILREAKSLTGEQVFGLRAHVLAYRWLRARGAKLRRSFSSPADLRLRRPDLVTADHRDILPPDLGLDARGRGRRWNIAELMKQGLAAAAEAGIRRPRNAEVIAHGLLAAALRNPLDSAPAGKRTLIRMMLFAAPEGIVEDEIREEIIARFCQAIEEHADDTAEKFDAWYSGGHSNLPKSLANRKTGSFGRLSVDEVKRVLQDLGWESHKTIANCAHATMRWVENSLADSLSSDARGWFEDVYLCRPQYGNLSLVMLMDRAGLLKPIVLRLWESPNDPALLGAFYRLLHFYEAMVDTRRAADRESKKAQQCERMTTLKMPRAHIEKPIVIADQLQATSSLLKLARSKGIRCANCGRELDFQPAGLVLDDANSIECHGTCTCSSRKKVIQIPWEEAIAAVEPASHHGNTFPAHKKARTHRPR
jgi:hypothetical protein